MGELIDPDKLVSLAELAKEFGYTRKHLARLATEGKFKAWRAGSFWVTTSDAFQEYVDSNPVAGRPVKKVSLRKTKLKKK